MNMLIISTDFVPYISQHMCRCPLKLVVVAMIVW